MSADRSAAFRLILAAGLILALPRTLSAQKTTKSHSDPRPTARASLRQGEISIDGKIDEAAWAAATPITELTQSQPDEGQVPSQKTEIRILYDASALYVGARMYDSLGAKGIRSALEIGRASCRERV